MEKFTVTPNLVRKIHLQEMKKILVKIDELLDKLDKVDAYGDIGENFCEDGGKMPEHRATRRLIKMVDKDLKEK